MPTSSASPPAEQLPVRSAAVWAALDPVVGTGAPLRVLDVGGGSGMFAVPLARLGHDVTVVDPSADALATLRRRADTAGVGERVHAIQGDVADPAFAGRCFDQCLHLAKAPVTALVNNAGITGRYGPFVELPYDVMHRTFTVNVLGTMTFAQEAVRRWRAAGIAGRIVSGSRGSPA